MKTSETAANAASANAAADSQSAVETTAMGEVRIHENVISALVRKAVLTIDGVSRLAGNSLVDNIAEIVGSRRMQDRAITVDLSEENRVSIEVKVNIKFGYKVPVVATAMQKAVIEQVENATGMTVVKVNVVIQELETEEENGDESETPAK